MKEPNAALWDQTIHKKGTFSKNGFNFSSRAFELTATSIFITKENFNFFPT
jgi:hypothetical protein